MKLLTPNLFAFLVSSAILTTLVPYPAKAQEVTRIQFAPGSYCGSYSGNFSGGREFVLNLGRGQTLTSRNTGGGMQTSVYVYGPAGQIEGYRASVDQINYQIPVTGDYHIYITSSTTYNAIEFCAY